MIVVGLLIAVGIVALIAYVAAAARNDGGPGGARASERNEQSPILPDVPYTTRLYGLQFTSPWYRTP